MAAASAVLAFRVAVGDFYLARATKHSGKTFMIAMELQKAVKWNPWETTLSVKFLDAMSVLALRMDKAQAKHLTGWIVEEAQRSVAIHPNDSFAYESLGKAIVLAAATGAKVDTAAASSNLDKAQSLAPSFTPLMRRRLAVAKLLNDKAGANKARGDLMRAKAWGDEGA